MCERPQLLFMGFPSKIHVRCTCWSNLERNTANQFMAIYFYSVAHFLIVFDSGKVVGSAVQ